MSEYEDAAGSVGSSHATAVVELIAGLQNNVSAMDTIPLAGHADVYQRVHAELQGALAELDSA